MKTLTGTGTSDFRLRFLADAKYASEFLAKHTAKTLYNLEVDGVVHKGMKFVEAVPCEDEFILRFGRCDKYGFGRLDAEPVEFSVEAVRA